MSEQLQPLIINEKFLGAYDNYADEIFAYCLEKTGHRDIAKYLTQAAFKQAWDVANYSDLKNSPNMRKLIFQAAKTKLAELENEEKSQVRYYDSIWNLTLSQ